MTLDQINKAIPEVRTRIASSFKTKDAQLLLDALEMDILDGITRRPIIEAGESSEAAISRWHSFLAGRRDILQIIRNIGEPRPIRLVADERPYEQGIDPRLVAARKNGFEIPAVQPKPKTK